MLFLYCIKQWWFNLNVDDLKNRHNRIRDSNVGEALLKNPDMIWQTSDFISKLSRRCRRCYTNYMNDIVRGVDTNKPEYYEVRLCKNCLALYKAKLNVLEK